MKYKLEGAVTIEGGEPEMPLLMEIEANNQLVDQLDLRSRHRFEHSTSNAPDTVKILAYDKSTGKAYRADTVQLTLDPSGWVPSNGDKVYHLEADIPWQQIDAWGDRVIKEAGPTFTTYEVKGKVVTAVGDGTKTLPVPNARVEILEHDPQRKSYWALPSGPWPQIAWQLPERRDVLGVVHTDDQGNFSYSFDWWNLAGFPQVPPRPADLVPDIALRVSQELDGRHSVLLESEPWMSIDPRADLGVVSVPLEKVLILGDLQVGPNVRGFQAIGLLPVDSTRIQDGYATSNKTEDLLHCTNAPFGGRLELRALFDNPQVTHYRLSHAPAGSTAFTEITDPLSDYRFDTTKKRWVAVPLGPSEVGGVSYLYRSIEKAQGYLFGGKLKGRWNTAKVLPGKVTLKIEGFRLDPTTQKAGPVAGAVYTLDLQIDSRAPKAKVLAIYRQGKVLKECEIIDLTSDPTQALEIEIEVEDSEGHLGGWALGTSRGYGRSIGGAFTKGGQYSSSRGIHWKGPGKIKVALPTGPERWRTCAYGFGLTAWSRSTDGRSAVLSSQKVHHHVNTYIQT